MQTVAIFGSSGATGRELARQLADNGATVHTIVRSRSTNPKPPQVTEHLVPSMNLTEFPDLREIDVVFCALGTTIAKAGSQQAFAAIDHDLIVAVGEWAKSQGAKQLHVISSLGATTNTRNFYLRTKGETERDLEALDLPSLTLYQPSLLHAPNRRDFRFGERLGYIALSALSWIPLRSIQRIKTVPVATLAACMIARSASFHPGCHRVMSDEIHRAGHPTPC